MPCRRRGILPNTPQAYVAPPLRAPLPGQSKAPRGDGQFVKHQAAPIRKTHQQNHPQHLAESQKEPLLKSWRGSNTGQAPTKWPSQPGGTTAKVGGDPRGSKEADVLRRSPIGY